MKQQKEPVAANTCQLCSKPVAVRVELAYRHPKYGINMRLCNTCARTVRREVTGR